MRGLKAVQQLGDDVNWREIVAYYQQAADEVRRFFVFVVAMSHRRRTPRARPTLTPHPAARAIQGLPEACCNLGVCHATGRGVPQDSEKAIHWYGLAAEKGLPRAQSNLAGCYASGAFLYAHARVRDTTHNPSSH